MSPRLPRVYLVRHGETEWSLSGQHTGTSDISLTVNGEKTIKALGPKIVGPGKLLDSNNLAVVFCSPRVRARKTLQLLFDGATLPPVEIEDDCQEWNYGNYEGKTAQYIRANEPGAGAWDIWTDGCPNGETAQEVSDRCDRVIAKILEIQKAHFGEGKDGSGDVLIVSHGHFTRCFLTRWCKLPLTNGRLFVSEAGAMSICGYQHSFFDERSLLGVNLFGEI